MPLEGRSFHFGDSVLPVGGVIFEGRFISKHASNPAPEYDAAPVAYRSSEGDLPWRGRIGVSTILDLALISKLARAFLPRTTVGKIKFPEKKGGRKAKIGD